MHVHVHVHCTFMQLGPQHMFTCMVHFLMQNNIFSDDFEKERKDRNRLAGEKVHLMEQHKSSN